MQHNYGKTYAVWNNMLNARTCMIKLTTGTTARELGNLSKLMSYCFKGRDPLAIVTKFQRMNAPAKQAIIRMINDTPMQILLSVHYDSLKESFK